MITVYPDVNRDYSLQTTDEFFQFTHFTNTMHFMYRSFAYFFLKPNIARGALVNPPPPLSRVPAYSTRVHLGISHVRR